MNLRKTDLPGIGRKYMLGTRSGDEIVIVIHNDGRREMFHMDDDMDICSMVTMDDEEARLVSGILAGLTYKPKALENLEMAFDDLVIEWLQIEPHFTCIGKKIGSLDIRARTGATIIAVMEKKGASTVNPGPDHTFLAKSTVVVAGDRTQIKKLRKLLDAGDE